MCFGNKGDDDDDDGDGDVDATTSAYVFEGSVEINKRGLLLCGDAGPLRDEVYVWPF